MKKHLIFLLKLLFTAGIFYWLLSQSGNTLAVLRQTRPLWVILAALVLWVQAALTAWRWGILLQVQNISLSAREKLSLTFQGIFFSLFIPGGSVSGDIVKAAMLASRCESGRKTQAVFSIFMDRVTGMIGLFSAALIMTAIYAVPLSEAWFRDDNGGGIRSFLVLLACIDALFAVSVAGTLVLIFWRGILEWRWVKAILTLVNRWSHGMVDQVLEALECYRAKPWTVILCMLLSVVVITPLLLLPLYLLGIAVATPGSTMATAPDFGITTLASAVANAASTIPATPGGLGTRDYFSRELLCFGGLASNAATVATLLYTAVMLLVSLTGGLFFLCDARKNKAAAAVQGESLSC